MLKAYLAELIIVISLLFSFQVKSDVKWNYVETREGIEIYKSESKELGSVIPFMAKGEINANVEDILSILLNSNEKKLWAPKLMDVKVHKKVAPGEYIFSEIYHAPWPFLNREFLLSGKIKVKPEGVVEITSTGFKGKNFSKYLSSDTVACEIKYVNIVLKSLSSTKTLLRFEFFGDMGGWIPVWIANMIQKVWPAKFIMKLRERVELIGRSNSIIYEDYLKNLKQGGSSTL